jgi:hypothetical protein
MGDDALDVVDLQEAPMRQLLSTLVVLMALVLSVASAPAEPISGGNNRAILTGETLSGDGFSTFKAVDVSTSGRTEVEELVMVDGFASGSGSSYRLVTRVRNDDDRGHCFVNATLQLRDAAGDDLISDNTFVDGSVGDMAGDIFTSSCVAPGETSYISSILIDDSFDALSAVEVSVDDTNTSGRDPDTVVIPVSYEVVDGSVEVTVENQGDVAASLGDGFHKIFFINSADEPVYWTFVDEVRTAVLEPGETTVMSTSLFGLGEDAAGVELLVDFSID